MSPRRRTWRKLTPRQVDLLIGVAFFTSILLAAGLALFHLLPELHHG